MKVTNFPYCCTARIIYDFGESNLAEGGDYDQDPVKLKEYIEDTVSKYDGSRGYFSPAIGALIAITNNQQKVTNRVLRKMGFDHSTWITKKDHPESKIRIWWYRIKEKDNG